MHYSFDLRTTAYSVNSYYYANRRFKTAEAKAYEAKILEMLEEHKPLLDMAEVWKANGGVFRIGIMNMYPHHLFYNRHGQISSKTFDCDNIIKPLIDLIFGFMGINDKNVIRVLSEKCAGPLQQIKIELELIVS